MADDTGSGAPTPGFPCRFDRNGVKNLEASEVFFRGSYSCDGGSPRRQCTIRVNWNFSGNDKEITLQGSVYRSQ